MPPRVLDQLDQRIVAALMVDGRATWRAIAEVLDASERTVTRRGTRLLESGVVEIRAMADPHRTARGDPYLVSGSSSPGRAWHVAATLARRAESITTYSLLGQTDYFCDIWCPEQRRSTLFQHELPDIPGVESMSVLPVLRYIRTLHDWDPGILDADQVAALGGGSKGEWPRFTDPVTLSRDERRLLTELTRDGRSTFEELARLCGVSEQTVARKVAALRQSQLLAIRAVFDPAILGLPVAALLWLRVKPARMDDLARTLAEQPYVRYAALITGQYQIVADIRLGSKDKLRETLSRSDWVGDVEAMDSSLILAVLKQSEVLAPDLR